VLGSSDPRVTWTASGGTISTTGLFTAGAITGVFTVRATSVVDPRAHAEALVTITPAGPPVLTGSVTINRSLVDTFETFTHVMSFSMTVMLGADETLTVTQITGSFVETMFFSLNDCPTTETLDAEIDAGFFSKTGTSLSFAVRAPGTDTLVGFGTVDENGVTTCNGSSTTNVTSGFQDIPVTIVRGPDGHIIALDFERHLDHYDATGQLAAANTGP
jgi:hypothetical protein